MGIAVANEQYFHWINCVLTRRILRKQFAALEKTKTQDHEYKTLKNH
jgi:hypothetical protein